MLAHRKTLELLVSEFAGSGLVGKRIIDAFSQHPDNLVMTLQSPEVRESLIVSCTASRNALYLREEVPRRHKNTIRFFQSLYGTPIKEVRLHPADRVIFLEFQFGEAIAISLWGAKANVVYLDQHGIVKESFKKPRECVGKALELRSASATEQELAEKEFETIFAHSTSSVAEILRQHYSHLGNLLLREALFRSGIDEDTPAAVLTQEAINSLLQVLKQIYDELRHPIPRIYFANGVPQRLSLIPLRHLAGYGSKQFDSVNAAIRFFIEMSDTADLFSSERKQIEMILQREEHKLRTATEKIEAEIQDESKADTYELYATLLKIHLNEIPRGATSISLTNIFSSSENGNEHLSSHGESVLIPLRPDLSPAENADSYFERARRSRRRRQEQLARLQRLRQKLAEVQGAIEQLQQVVDAQTLKQFRQRFHKLLSLPSLQAMEKKTEERALFRTFTVSGGYEVWVGKDGPSNDELTTKYAKPYDLWLHARGVSGSHVVLRVRNKGTKPPRETVHQAAQIAAYYSKARTSSLIPVIVTERKYVHKRKGSAPGEVMVDREEVLIVKPALPSSHRKHEE